ncbi:MAG: RelA/SpoT domain-containing protein [Armatimonadetes bacterium]|nr:RelA/SpoT domain-containing protein [Armatimonadota bacterium]
MAREMPGFAGQLSVQLPKLEDAADRLEDYIVYALSTERVLFHAVVARPKSLKSALRKQAKKAYADPLHEMTDLVGVRVFTYFRDDARVVEDALKKHFVVDEPNSINKADGLEFNTFGYTSRHLVMSAGPETDNLQLKAALGDLKFEVQIRTVLEHGWAEVEHELVYKAGTEAPDAIRRRFAASAAALELIEREFADLRGFEAELISGRVEVLKDGAPAGAMDRAWFVAVLSAAFPDRQTWSPLPQVDNFFRGLELEIMAALDMVGVTTVAAWSAAVGDPRIVDAIETYALHQGIPAESVNHFPIALFAAKVSGVEAQEFEFVDEDLRTFLTNLLA